MPMSTEEACDILIAGGGIGGVAAALRATAMDCSVIILEENKWLGGQMTSQGVSALDEHKIMETFGGTASYCDFKERVRQYYLTNFKLSKKRAQLKHFNPGCKDKLKYFAFEPTVGVKVLEDMLIPAIKLGNLKILNGVQVVKVIKNGDKITEVISKHMTTGEIIKFYPRCIVDATELGDLLPLAQIPYRTGVEAFSETNEPSAPPESVPEACQAFTFSFALEWNPGSNNTIRKPEQYDEFCEKHRFSLTGLKMFTELGKVGGSFWTYRQILDVQNFDDPLIPNDITLINCACTDYREESIIDRDLKTVNKHLFRARQLALSYLYWLQTEAPRDEGGRGYPELCIRPDLTGTDDGVSQYPYIRECRRLKSLFTIREQDIVANFNNGNNRARLFYDSVGIGWYLYTDIHWCCHTKKRSGSGQRLLPFQIPLGALMTDSAINFIAGAKNIGTTHITNGAYRLHPVEWNIGESAGALAAFSVITNISPNEVFYDKKLLHLFQLKLLSQGIPLYWFDDIPLEHSAFSAVQYLALQGIIVGSTEHLHFFPDQPLQKAIGTRWITRAKRRFDLEKDIIADLENSISMSPTQAQFAEYLFNVIRKQE